ncbi:MAG TPA: class I tRNA ligase family protein, partial [Candidatus Edwardsbacteria bacterium]|nr:class I tRNA ligase family protein [Candidatus Edwardsbacteria bacterium]
MLPKLEQLRDMANAGTKLELPLTARQIPLIADVWAKPELGSGCVKITPGHDPNDYEVWGRQQGKIAVINILNPDGTLNANAGAYQGLDRFAARDKVLADLTSQGLVESVEDRQVEIGHSDRSKTPIEPYLSRQWFVRMGDIDGGVLMGRGTAGEFRAPGLAQAAIDAVCGTWRSHSGRTVAFHPFGERYRSTYVNWLAEKRDWCISRQLWWGHRIPIWSQRIDAGGFATMRAYLEQAAGRPEICVIAYDEQGRQRALADLAQVLSGGTKADIQVCLLDESADAAHAKDLESRGFTHDDDVLDTWFSSAIWPHSTLGWPDPATAGIDAGQSPLGPVENNPDCLSYYYPGSCLVTGRDIITLWVARMVLTGLYNMGDVPFTDVFIHANIQDGKGERMSKSKGNGIDPVDIIEKYGADAMRYVVCEMQTGTQDIRLPVQAVSPYTGQLVDLAAAKHGSTIFTYLDPATGKEFDVLGTMPGVPAAKLVSERFDVGRNFCNKLWNAFRFALMNLEGAGFEPREPSALAEEDRWLLSRLTAAIATVHAQLDAYNPASAIGAAREFFWSELCDWYLELIKPRLKAGGEDAASARQVLAYALDQLLRLLHPFVPYITEELWTHLGQAVPRRGIDRPLPGSPLLIAAAWPRPGEGWRDAALEERFGRVMEVIRAVRDIRTRYAVPPSRKLAAAVKADGAARGDLAGARAHIMALAGLERFEVAADAARPADAAAAVVAGAEIYVAGLIDAAKERARLAKEIAALRTSIDNIAAKLADAGFAAKAPPQVVAKEQGRLAEYRDKLAKLEAQAAALP